VRTFCGIRKKYDAYCRKYLEVHGRAVDFITPSIEGATFYFSARFVDKTDFPLRYACEMLVLRADFCDIKTGNFRNDSRIHEASSEAETASMKNCGSRGP
jgi:hypothetical protein